MRAFDCLVFGPEASLFGRHRRGQIWRYLCISEKRHRQAIFTITEEEHYRFTSSLMACVVGKLHRVETWTGNAGQLPGTANPCRKQSLLSQSFFRDSLNTTPNISFLADGLNIFPQALATHLPCVTFRFIRQTLQTLLQLLSFWAGLFSLFPTSEGLQILKFNNFLAQNNKNKNYENPLAPTDFVTKEVAWF